jgi:aldehyde dehydrogenase (NAD+)
MVAKNSPDTMKRLTLELGGKSPNIILDAPISPPRYSDGCRSLLPEQRSRLHRGFAPDRAGRPAGRSEAIGEDCRRKNQNGRSREQGCDSRPIGQRKYYKRVQEYIQSGIEEGAELVIGGEGHPSGLEDGNLVKPTVLTNVTRDMRITKEEIFGPVLSILTYKTEAEAIDIADDTEFGLIAYVSSADPERANRVAGKLAAGRVPEPANKVEREPG